MICVINKKSDERNVLLLDASLTGLGEEDDGLYILKSQQQLDTGQQKSFAEVLRVKFRSNYYVSSQLSIS